MPEIGDISPYFSPLGEASAITGLKSTTPIIPCVRPAQGWERKQEREVQREHRRHVEDGGEVAEDPGAVVMYLHEGATETTFSLKCLKDKLFPIGATVLVTVLLIAVIALAARKCPSCPSPILPTCSENGIGFREKCFYFVEDEANWNESQSFCLSLGAQLATIDSEEDLGFLLRYGRTLHYWVGLHQEGSDPWRWCNGSLFNNRFDIQGNGQCAYIDLDGVSSDWCSQQKHSVCSHPLKSPRRAERGGEP
ncbi:C-type lectin domain family 2 member A-like isoform X3 [Anas acuta]|uniref:C-type lectin domain family 2 member A-like isoform X3 n=1 Tax=Anas acuta TaxID=28680 RepID=UPI0035C91E02